ncbi:hypothetical protein AAZV13_19G019900 [Glycine max]
MPSDLFPMPSLHLLLDAKGHCLLKMPTGTGKTITLLSLITSYILSKPHSSLKLLYCTCTVHEMEKTLAELCLLHDYQLRHISPTTKILALSLSSRFGCAKTSLLKKTHSNWFQTILISSILYPNSQTNLETRLKSNWF